MQVLERAEDPELRGADSRAAQEWSCKDPLQGPHLQLFPRFIPLVFQESHRLNGVKHPPPGWRGCSTLIDSLTRTSSNIGWYISKEKWGAASRNGGQTDAEPARATGARPARMGSGPMILEALPGKASSNWRTLTWAPCLLQGKWGSLQLSGAAAAHPPRGSPAPSRREPGRVRAA